jgi:hypothetical protein
MVGWRELYKENLSHFCPLPIVITMITSRTMRLARLVAGKGEMRNFYRQCFGRQKKSDH